MNMIKIYLRCWVGLIFIAFLPIFLQAACDLPSQLQVTPGPSQTVFSWSGNGTSYLIEVEKSNSQTIVPEKTVSAPYSHTLAAGSLAYCGLSFCNTSASGWVYLTPRRESVIASSYPSCGVAVIKVVNQVSIIKKFLVKKSIS